MTTKRSRHKPTVRAVQMCALLSKHNVHISPVRLDEADTEVLRYPVKSKNKSTNKMIELVITAGIKLSDKLNLPEQQHPALVDNGAQIEVLAEEEVFAQEALLDAPMVSASTYRSRGLTDGFIPRHAR